MSRRVLFRLRRYVRTRLRVTTGTYRVFVGALPRSMKRELDAISGDGDRSPKRVKRGVAQEALCPRTSDHVELEPRQGVKRKACSVQDPGDRAEAKRKGVPTRVLLSKMGFYYGNRGGLGISSHHVHEVAHDCMTNKTKPTRYNYVALIEIPPPTVWRSFVRVISENVALMG